MHVYNARRLVESDLDVRIAQKLQPIPAEAATEVGADPPRRRNREREYRGLIAIVTLPWAIVIGAVQLWNLILAFL